MSIVELAPSELEQPISVTTGGAIATLRDLIAEKASNHIQAMFGVVAAESSAPRVRPVADLDRASLQRVAVEMLRKSDPAHRVAATGLGDFNQQQLIDEVEHDTAMGARVIYAVQANGIFLEEAVATGRIRPKGSNHNTELRLPDFDF